MIIAGLYVFFLVLFTAIGIGIGYFADESWPGSGTLIGTGAFLAAVWIAWVVTIRISEHFWPEQPTA
jgi:hypothetical protein